MNLPPQSGRRGGPLLAGVRVAYWDADSFGSIAQHLARLLTEDERSRAGRILSSTERARFVVSRTILRSVLGPICREDPRRLRLGYGIHGTPRLQPMGGGRSIEFSLSHSASMSALAVSPGPGVGVDIEEVKRIPEAGAYAERRLPSLERRILDQFNGGASDRAFLQMWTSQEAYFKATGIPRFDVGRFSYPDALEGMGPGPSTEGPRLGYGHYFYRLDFLDGFVGTLVVQAGERASPPEVRIEHVSADYPAIALAG